MQFFNVIFEFLLLCFFPKEINVLFKLLGEFNINHVAQIIHTYLCNVNK